MPARIAFSTHYPDRMGDLAGKTTRFPERIITMIDPLVSHENMNMDDLVFKVAQSGAYDFNFKVNFHPKTTTIRSNYEYWKSKEGQLIQPFFWAGKPYRSKQVVFCPEVRLKRVSRIFIQPSAQNIIIVGFIPEGDKGNPNERFDQFVKEEGFDHPNHFWMWFNQDFDGALLELESVGGMKTQEVNEQNQL